jgi:NAD(P)-binding Rossmann-like domain
MGIAVNVFKLGAVSWALVETDRVPIAHFVPRSTSQMRTSKTPMSIGIIGGGFSGLSAAAGLLKKRVDAKITIFEELDTLLPLQQGCDSRWLHPHIYDWPGDGSEVTAAYLPVLNWTAARASDVVVQVLGEWKRVVKEHRETSLPSPDLFCNSRHLQISISPVDPKKASN